jgi:hypothetical protein
MDELPDNRHSFRSRRSDLCSWSRTSGFGMFGFSLQVRHLAPATWPRMLWGGSGFGKAVVRNLLQSRKSVTGPPFG